MSSQPTRPDDTVVVLVADASPLVSQAVAESLSSRPPLRALPYRPLSGEEAVRLARSHKPSVVVLDFWLPGMEGPAIAHEITSGVEGTKVIFLSAFYGPRQIENALAAGAVGFFPKNISLETLVGGILRAHSGEAPVYAAELEEMMAMVRNRGGQAAEAWTRLGTLTRREVDVLMSVSSGRPLAEVARQLFVSPATLQRHIHNIQKKTGARSRMEAVAMAQQHGLIQP